MTQEDAAKVLHAELRGSSTGEPHPGGVAAAVQAAADINEKAGFTLPSSSDHARAFPLEDTPVPEDMPNSSSVEQTESIPKPASAEGKVHVKED